MRAPPWGARPPGGVTLLEVVIAMSLLALGFMFVLGIVPTSITSVKRSEDIAAATAYGMEIVEYARRSMPTEPTKEFKVTFNQTEFKFTREVVPAEDGLSDVIVTVHWTDTHPDVRLVTRLRGDAPTPTPRP